MKRNVAAIALALIMGGSGVLHFAKPQPYRDIVPPALGRADLWVAGSGLLELAVCAALLRAKTRSAGALACVVLLVAVFPANVYAALNGGYSNFAPPFDSEAVAIGRLPFQAVLIWWAWRLRR